MFAGERDGEFGGWGGKYQDSMFRHSPLCPFPEGDFYLDQGPCVAVAFPSAPHPGGTYSSPSCQVPNWICYLTPPSYGEGKSSDAWARPPISLRGEACLFLFHAFLLPDGFSIFPLSELGAALSSFDKERKRQLLFPLSLEGSQAN